MDRPERAGAPGVGDPGRRPSSVGVPLLTRPDPAALGGLDLLEGATQAELAGIAGRMELLTVDRGQVLGREGEPGDTFWLVMEGRVSVATSRRHLAEAGPGSIVGELALLRDRPRTASVTAVAPGRLAEGRSDALEELLQVDPVRQRVRRLASARLAQDLRPVPAQLHDGTWVRIRPLLPSDREAFDEAVQSLSIDTIRRRFFTAARPTPALIDYLMDLDYVHHFAWVALGGMGQSLATARYARLGDEAEMAFTTADEYQGRGLGTLLFGALGVAAVEAGIDRLVAHVLEDNRAMRAVFAKAGARVAFDEPGVVLVTVDPNAAAALLDPDSRGRLGSAVHDVVTAASLALRS